MNTENFDLNKIKTLSPNDAKLYIDKFFIPLSNGDHAYFENGKYVIKDDGIIKRTYFKRMPKELYEYYFTQKTDVKTISYDINKPKFYEHYINMCPQLIHEYKAYSEFSEEIKINVNIMLDHVKNVLCSGNEECYIFILKWFSQMVKGNKNDSCLYLKSGQGTGKSTFIDFMREYVIGNSLSVQCGSGPFKTKFNSELSGKLLVQLEELENTSSNEWTAISSVLKRNITSDIIMIEGKGKDPVEEKNLNNYVILSNNDAIRDDDGRRYFILDISTHQVGNLQYFENIRHKCFNINIGWAFYCYLKEINTNGFYSQNYPLTQAKKDSHCKRLDNVYTFLKDTYLLQKESFKGTVQELYNLYVEYMKSIGKGKTKGKIDFNKTLDDIGIKYYGSSNKNIYNIEYSELLVISKKYKWIHELDEFNPEEDNDDNEIYGFGKSEIIKKYEEQKKELEALKLQLEELEKKNKKLKKKVKKYESEETEEN